MIASHRCCRFVGCTSMMLLFHHIPKVLCWIEIWWQWRALEYSELCIILLEVGIRRWGTLVIMGWSWSATILRQAVVFNHTQLVLRAPKCAKKYPPQHYLTTTNLNNKAGRMLSCCLHHILPRPAEWNLKSRLITPGSIFCQFYLAQFGWVCVNCSLSSLFLADRSGT